MNEIRLKNFRCFREEQRARLAPLTLLVGENSTGKTSFLAMIRALWDVAHRRSPSFKEPPYDLGSFEEIAHYRKGRPGRTESFEAGFTDAVQLQGEQGAAGLRQYCFDVVFSRSGTVPAPAKWRLGSEDAWIEERVDNGSSRWIHFGTTNGSWRRKVPTSLPQGLPSEFRQVLSLVWYVTAATPSPDLDPLGSSPPMTKKDEEQMTKLALLHLVPAAQRPFAGAPVRSKPLRTYDPSDPSSEPEGANVPMYLSAAFFDDKQWWDALKTALEKFGHDAGLFDDIAVVSPLGKEGSGPFQVHVRKHGKRAKGPMRNLIDVGYGVSQVLPVITELLRGRDTPLFLLQQPEVHLHPSAQAALGSLFCGFAAHKRQLVVETHSDHLVDRVRMDVRDGMAGLKPEDVSILYFERRDLDVQIHSLRLDGRGNVLNAPRSYRRFFLDETRRSLGL